MQSNKASRWMIMLAVLAFGLANGAGSAKATNIVITPQDAIQSFTVQGSGQVTVTVTDVGQGGICRENMYGFRVDDASGSIDGVLPGDSGWPAAVQSRAQLVHADSDNAGASVTMNLQAGDILGFSFENPCIVHAPFLYSFVPANPQIGPWYGVFLDAYSVGTNTWELGWEDGADSDYNDIIVDVSNVQGNTFAPPTDTTPPAAPQITDSPPDTFNSDAASFSFTDDEAGVAFLCQIDTASFSDCASPQGYSGLTEGSHTFSVEAKDAAGNISPATSYSWTIDLGPCTQADTTCILTAAGSSSSDVPDPSPCGAVQGATDTLTATPDAACSASKKQHCAWFYDDEPINGKTQGITFVIHQFTPHIEFHYCLTWNKAVTSVDGMLASNVYKKYPWVYKGLLQDPVVGGLGTSLAKVTFSMNYQQCVLGHFGCFDSRNVVLEATINAKAKDHTNPVTVKVTSD